MATVVRAFSYTGSAQSWTVPTGVTSVRMELWGAAGGSISTTARTYPQHNDEMTAASYASAAPTAFQHTDIGSNPGGYVAGDRTVTPGDTYTVYVGGNGQNGYTGSALSATGGWNGGGLGGPGHNFTTLTGQSGGGGGGATAIRYGGPSAGNRNAGGGGGGGEPPGGPGPRARGPPA